MLRFILHKRGQAIFEYAIIIGVVGLALLSMNVYLRRGIQAGIQLGADALGAHEGTLDYRWRDVISGPQTIMTDNRSNASHQVLRRPNEVYGVVMDSSGRVFYPEGKPGTWSGWEIR